MSNNAETQNPLREIFASIKGPAWWDRPDVDVDSLAAQAVEKRGERPSTENLDKLAEMLDGKAPASTPSNSSEAPLPESDLFPEPPMTLQDNANAEINAIGEYAKIMITLSQLRARTAGWIDIPTSDELNGAFQKASEGDIEKQLAAAIEYQNEIATVIEGKIATIIEDNMRGWKKVQEHVGQVETHLSSKTNVFDLPVGFTAISKGISETLHEERRLSAFIDHNVISLERYPLPLHPSVGNM